MSGSTYISGKSLILVMEEWLNHLLVVMEQAVAPIEEGEDENENGNHVQC